ncbi:MAG: radical SAM peptide maturase [Bacteroidales bacterium]|nr:radical SAM peptide maturase [Bacteroidales bacterium]
MQRTTFFSTTNKNSYLYSFKRNYFLFAHPIIRRLYQKEFSTDDEKYYDLTRDKNDFSEKQTFSYSDYKYYIRKYRMIKESGCFSEKDGSKIIDGLLSPHDIEYELCNLRTLVFEVTEKCNLSCDYCFYGDHYSQYEKRKNLDFPLENAIAMLVFLKEKWTSKQNISREKEIYIGFYGGEPLLNFPFISTIVKHVQNIQQQTGLKFRFNMTTNAVLLDKYIDYLVEHNFALTLSIDGNKFENGYRVFPNGKPSYNIVYKNIMLLKSNYPTYYQQSVLLNAVLHDKNNFIEIEKFAKNEFDKTIRGSEVNPLLVGKDFKYKGHKYDLIKENDARCFLSSDEPTHYNMFLRNFTNFHFEDYNDLYYSNKAPHFLPTGTCNPFSKRMFITAQGKILPCEVVGHGFALGEVVDGKVELEINNIANTYNTYFKRIRIKCNTCHRINFCTDCLFLNIIKNGSTLICNMLNSLEHGKLLEDYYTFFETFPKIYYKIWEDARYV